MFAAPADEQEAEAEASKGRGLPEYIGSQPPSNKHVRTMQEILLTYNIYEQDLGYVQGMSDLCSPLYITMGGDPGLTFACFCALMDRMVGGSH